MFLLLSFGALFSKVLSLFIGKRGTVVLDIVLVWLIARLVARALMFPGSLKIFQRNTEATFRIEIARQYVHYLRQLWIFLRHAATRSTGPLRGVSVDGLSRGFSVIETLAETFRAQQRDEVFLSKEQEHVHAIAQDLEQWLGGLRVQGRCDDSPRGFSAGPVLFPRWIRAQSAGGLPGGTTPRNMLSDAVLADEEPVASQHIAKLEGLLVTLDDLRHQKPSPMRNAMRFLRTPIVGSLNQLRAEMQMRFSGQHCWIRTRGDHRLDAMFLPSKGAQGDDAVLSKDSSMETAGWPDFSGPTVIICNPNAAYYETMVYQPSWLNFWLRRGYNVLLFNYAGYGRSTGKPSPPRIAEDGDCVINFLKSKGISMIGVYGRSIGGIAACHLARRHPEDVHLLVVDRSMSTLEETAKHMYGPWAATALRWTSMAADNVDNFIAVRCYKLMVCDPKDSMILDIAALRTAVALRVLEKLAPEDKLHVDDEQLSRLVEAWRFFGALLDICDADDDNMSDGVGSFTPSDMNRSARQPSLKAVSGDGAGSDTPGSGRGVANSNSNAMSSAAPGERAGVHWLEENASVVRLTMACLADQVRSALDVVGEHLEGGGVSLHDVFLDNPGDAAQGIRCMLANLQVWGALGEQRGSGTFVGWEPAGPDGATDRDEDPFESLDAEDVDPCALSAQYRRLARTKVGQVREEYRRRLSALLNFLTQSIDLQAGEHAEYLFQSVVKHLHEVDTFVADINRFFMSVDLAARASSVTGSVSGAGGERSTVAAEQPEAQGAAEPHPAVDRAVAGHIMHVDCGHNGALDELDLRRLSVHLRAAGFGRPEVP